jgi:hypothetical protein
MKIESTKKAIYLAGNDCPFVAVELELTEACKLERQGRGEPVPDKISGIALIDTGATNSEITKKVLEKFRLSPIKGETIRRQTSETSIDSSSVFSVYNLRLSIPHIKFSIEPLKVAQTGGWPHIEDTDIVAIIGHDVLSKLVLHYDGPKRKISLDMPSELVLN